MNYKKIIKKLILLTIIFNTIILPSFSLSQSPQAIELPKTIEEVKKMGLRSLDFIPNFFKNAWQEFVIFWQKVWNWFLNIWNSHIYPFFNNIWQKTIGREIEERRPMIEEEFKKEKEEVKQEVKTYLPTGKSLWEKFIELFR